MANITYKRTGEFIRIVVDLLLNEPDGLPAKEILAAIPKTIHLTNYEQGFYPSTPESPRYEKIVRFATIDLVKAGWMAKSKGRWYLTDEGRQAYKKFPDPEDFYKEAVRLYHEWKRSQPKEEIEEPKSIEVEAEKTVFTFEEAEETAWEQIQAYLQGMSPYDFQQIVADLLEAMGYHVSWVAPPGKDKGVDIIAYTDPLGASNPRIKVQVKRKEGSIPVEGLRSFLSVLVLQRKVGIFRLFYSCFGRWKDLGYKRFAPIQTANLYQVV